MLAVTEFRGDQTGIPVAVFERAARVLLAQAVDELLIREAMYFRMYFFVRRRVGLSWAERDKNQNSKTNRDEWLHKAGVNLAQDGFASCVFGGEGTG